MPKRKSSPAITSWLFCTGAEGPDLNDAMRSSTRGPPPSSCKVLVMLRNRLLLAYLILNTKVAWAQPEFVREDAVGTYIQEGPYETTVSYAGCDI